MNFSSTSLRPGIVSGVYPQKQDVRDGWLDKTAGRVNGFLRQYLQARRAPYLQFVDQVNEVSADLNSMDESSLQTEVLRIKRALYSEGLQDNLVARSFSLVREFATRKLGMRHHDVQVFGGYVMLNGMIAEMETGEGKTMTATLPACTAAMAGIPVHIVTVNDFLVTRDADWMRPVFEAMGLTVGCITEDLDLEQRREAYRCDVTYCTNKQLTFDYLKDSLLLGQESRRLHMQLESLYREQPRTSRLLMRGLCFAIVDEADSVLVDEARTPLIISKQGDASQEVFDYEQAIRIARGLKVKRDFSLRGRDKQIELTDFGKASIALQAKELSGIWAGAKRRNELVTQALAALHLYLPDIHYLVKDEAIQIIDEYTGRTMPDRSWERGLHQMIEVKEGCELSARQETLARISYQRFFRRYLRVAGMTGTAKEISSELWSVYRLGVVKIPTNLPLARQHVPDKVFAREDDKWTAIVATIRALNERGRPVLIGTQSVADSELLGSLLTSEGLPHQVLNARQDEQESEIVSQAGRIGRITVATNMAGRGTDIRLEPGVKEMGGLYVLATCRHEARRIDRQLFGRGGRQGDPGSYQTIISLEDDIFITVFGERTIASLVNRLQHNRPLPTWISRPFVAFAQFRAERHHSKIRRNLLKLDDNLGDMLAFSGRGE